MNVTALAPDTWYIAVVMSVEFVSVYVLVKSTVSGCPELVSTTLTAGSPAPGWLSEELVMCVAWLAVLVLLDTIYNGVTPAALLPSMRSLLRLVSQHVLFSFTA